jgi:cytochrome c oxidase subunit 2
VIGTPQDPPELVLPVGQTVRIVLTSDDVIHAFYVPGFLFKRDAIPGRVTEFDLIPREEGEFRGFCAEFCGLDHARMTFTVRTVSPEEFEQWLEAARAAEGSP